MSTNLDDERMLAWRLFLEAHARVLTRLEQELEDERRLPLTWYDVLVQLNRAPEKRLRLQDLGHNLVISKSGLSRRIDRMEEAGLVERHECPSDARGVFAVLTPAGKAVLKDAAPVHLAGIAQHFTQYLTDEEAAALQAAFRKILAGLQDGRSER
jgi:DNA-binding MarR family transcriptional regulator